MTDRNAAEPTGEVDASTARRLWRALETYHGMIYFVPEADEEYQAVGIEPGRMGYFASRAAPMGPVPADVVVATFFNFCPDLVRSVIPRAWELASPADLLAARLRAVDRALRKALGEGIASDDIDEAASLARTATEACTPQGRPLYAGHASVPWPDEPHLVLWHAVSLLREFRGDGHIASLLTEGVGPLAALVLHASSGAVPPKVLRSTRAWPDDQWDAMVAQLAAAGLIDRDGSATEAGAALRQRVEHRTDELALAPWQHLGTEGCARLRELGKAASRALIASGAFPGR